MPNLSLALCFVCVKQRLKVKWWPWWWCIVGTWLSHLGHAALNWCSTSLRLAPFSTLFLGLHSPPSLHLSNLWDLSTAPLYVCSSTLLISIVYLCCANIHDVDLKVSFLLVINSSLKIEQKMIVCYVTTSLVDCKPTLLKVHVCKHAFVCVCVYVCGGCR